MTFDLEKYEDAIMSQDDAQRVKAGLELAEIVPQLERETLERFSQQIVDLLLKSLHKTDWEFRNLISNALLLLGKQDFVAKSTGSGRNSFPPIPTWTPGCARRQWIC